MDENNVIGLAEVEIVSEEQRLTALEQAAIQHQQQLRDVQLQFAATLQAALDALRVLLGRAAAPFQPERPVTAMPQQDT